MKRSKTIEIVVATDGQISVEAMGFAGGSCLEATKLLEQALGHEVQRRRKPEFYRTQAAVRKQALGGGRRTP
jgi:hypothetical protein